MSQIAGDSPPHRVLNLGARPTFATTDCGQQGGARRVGARWGKVFVLFFLSVFLFCSFFCSAHVCLRWCSSSSPPGPSSPSPSSLTPKKCHLPRSGPPRALTLSQLGTPRRRRRKNQSSIQGPEPAWAHVSRAQNFALFSSLSRSQFRSLFFARALFVELWPPPGRAHGPPRFCVWLLFLLKRDTAETHHTLEERKKSDTTRINHTTLRGGGGHVPPRGTVAPGRRHPDHLATPTSKPQKLVQPHKK